MTAASRILEAWGQGPAGPPLPKTPTGIAGLDDVTGGGLPRGRTTLVSGPAGSGKTLLGLQFLVAGAREFGEPGVFVTFEESGDKVAANVASLGFDVEALEGQGLLDMLAFQLDPNEVIQTGAFDFEPLLLLIGSAVAKVGARRVVLDTIEVLFGAFKDEAVVRSELTRLIRWMDDQGLTAVVTGERGEKGLTRHGIEEYVSDCVILLDHRVHAEVSTRRLRVLKYRGSAHGTNEFPFLIGPEGLLVLPITSISLDYPASPERVSTGVARLDTMLGGGVFKGSMTLVSGSAGTGKSTLGAHLVNAACARGESALLLLYEESPDQVVRNMSSVGLDLQQWLDAGLLAVWAARPTAHGLETHLAILAQLLKDHDPSVAVLDGIGAFSQATGDLEVSWMLARQVDLLKSRQVTTMATTTAAEGDSQSGVSSLVDTWLLLRNLEQNGERNRLLYVLKSRGMAHSNQVREFLLTDDGAQLLDVYLGQGQVLTGAARQIQEQDERKAADLLASKIDKHRRELRRSITDGEARLASVKEDLIAAREELQRLETGSAVDLAAVSASREAMSRQRWGDDPQGEPDG